MIVLELAQQRDGHQLGRALEQRHDFGFPDVGERIGTRAPIASRVLRRQRDRALDAARAALADAGLGRGQRLGLVLADVHVEANLLIGDSGSWHGADLFLRPEPAIVNPHQPGAAGSSSSTAATPPSTPHHRPSWLSFNRTR